MSRWVLYQCTQAGSGDGLDVADGAQDTGAERRVVANALGLVQPDRGLGEGVEAPMSSCVLEGLF
jgi:hypothetical protein